MRILLQLLKLLLLNPHKGTGRITSQTATRTPEVRKEEMEINLMIRKIRRRVDSSGPTSTLLSIILWRTYTFQPKIPLITESLRSSGLERLLLRMGDIAAFTTNQGMIQMSAGI